MLYIGKIFLEYRAGRSLVDQLIDSKEFPSREDAVVWTAAAVQNGTKNQYLRWSAGADGQTVCEALSEHGTVRGEIHSA